MRNSTSHLTLNLATEAVPVEGQRVLPYNVHPDPLLSVREGAPLLGISIPTFWRWVANGTLPPPVKLGGMSRWPRSELIAFIEAAKARRSV